MLQDLDLLSLKVNTVMCLKNNFIDNIDKISTVPSFVCKLGCRMSFMNLLDHACVIRSVFIIVVIIIRQICS